MYEVEEYASKEVVEEAAAYMKMGLIYQMSPVNFEDSEWAKTLNDTRKRTA